MVEKVYVYWNKKKKNNVRFVSCLVISLSQEPRIEVVFCFNFIHISSLNLQFVQIISVQGLCMQLF